MTGCSTSWSARSATPRCASTRRPASWSAPGRTAGSRTRCATTSPSCSSTRRATPRRASAAARPAGRACRVPDGPRRTGARMSAGHGTEGPGRGAGSPGAGDGSPPPAAGSTGPAARHRASGARAAGPGAAEGGPVAEHGSAGRRSVLAAFAANIGIAVTKFVAFVITGSASMLAESVHSVADSGNQALLLLGRSRARRKETEEHQFGFGAERYFYGFIVALVLFTVGALFSIYEGLHRISHPEELSSPVVALVVLGIAALLEGFSFRTAVKESNQVRGRRAWFTFIRRAKAPELPTVLLEDFAALIGLGLAVIGVALTMITGDDRWDGVGSIGIGVLLGCVAVILAIETKSLLIGESANAEVE